MRPFVVRVFVNALTLIAVLALFALIRLPGANTEGRWVLDVPLLQMENASLLRFISLGFSLALVAAFVRPV